MATAIIHEDRIDPLNDLPPHPGGRYVLYAMLMAQRAEHNEALEYAVQRANEAGKPLLVAFGIDGRYPGANARHYRFMLQGLADVADALERRDIGFVLLHEDPAQAVIRLAGDAVEVVTDRTYLRPLKAWTARIAEQAGRRVTRVETNLIVPVGVASDKPEFAARTIRPKLHRTMGEFLVELNTTAVDHGALDLKIEGDLLEVSDPDGVLEQLDVDHSVPPVDLFTGGTTAAKRVLRRFLKQSAGSYAENRNQPQTDHVSYMSMHLHFGQLSPVWLARMIQEVWKHHKQDREAYLEELIVRRELSHNYTEYQADYDRYAGLPDWARKTLDEHRDDEREHVYTRQQLEDAQTHDRYWNAAMREMRHTGFMHNYMRMYWGKKILEWTRTPEHGFKTALELNNKYFLDGSDPNSFVGVGWVFGLHDRPWTERPVFGKTRYMNAKGLERKCDIGGYVDKVDRLVDGEPATLFE